MKAGLGVTYIGISMKEHTHSCELQSFWDTQDAPYLSLLLGLWENGEHVPNSGLG
jgi:hypothetical protein